MGHTTMLSPLRMAMNVIMNRACWQYTKHLCSERISNRELPMVDARQRTVITDDYLFIGMTLA